MSFRFYLRVCAAWPIAAALVACGDPIPQPAAHPPTKVGASALPAQAAELVTPSALFDWAEQVLPGLFPPQGKEAGELAPYSFRFYPGTGNHLGVANGTVHVMGPVSGGEVLEVGSVDSFACMVSPDACAGTSSVTLPTGLGVWFAGFVADGAGKETLLLTTVRQHNELQPPTPLFALRGVGSLVRDVTPTLFEQPPSFYWPRGILPLRHPGTGTTALYFCNQGKEVASGPPGAADGNNYPNGYWAEQDRLFVMQHGRFVERTGQLPQSVDFSHGCSVGQVDGVGGTDIVKNTLGSFNGYPAQQALAWNGSAFSPVFATTIGGEAAPFYTLTGDFSRNGIDEMILGTKHFRKSGDDYAEVASLTPPDIIAAGYTLMHGGATGDLDGDGWTDAVLVFSKGVDLRFGVRIAVFLNDGQGKLVYRPGAASTAVADEMSIEIRLFDVNFDSRPDIVVTGGRAGDLGVTNRDTRAVLVNDGSGTFHRRHIRDAELDARCGGGQNWCHDQTYFTRNGDGTYQLMIGEFDSATASWRIHTRRVTPQQPLNLVVP